MENNQNKLTEIDKQRILKEAKAYSEEQMKISEKKSSNKFFMYGILLVLVTLLFYSFAFFYRYYMFLRMGL